MPSLNRITPLILTYNEASNIDRTLARLGWAERVLVVDSGSDDRTPTIVRSYDNTELLVHPFDTYSRQWNYGLERVETDWTLALDADYRLPEKIVDEIASIPDDSDKSGFFVDFDYVVLGSRLSRSLYPPRQVLFRTDRAVFEDDGHRQRVRVEGQSGRLQGSIIHDDRKPLDRWIEAQERYARREAEKLVTTPWRELTIPDRIRRTRVLAPPLVLLYTLFGKRLILDGWPGWYYALERTVAEMVLALALLRKDRRGGSGEPVEAPDASPGD